MKSYKNNSGFSVILAILMTWFMLLLTTWIFLLVLSENKDTKGMEYYFKSLEWAEWGLELAMLKAKQFDYSYDEKIDSTHPISKVLCKDINNCNHKDVIITYDLNSTGTWVRDKQLESGKFDIYPLFSKNIDGSNKKVTNISKTWLNNDNIVWNIVWENSWMSGIWNFTNITQWNFKTIWGTYWNEVSFDKKSIENFLNVSENNYLILQNIGSSEITYTLNSLNNWEYLTKDASNIIASWENEWMKQNIIITINNSKYLNLLKYSIFSN